MQSIAKTEIGIITFNSAGVIENLLNGLQTFNLVILDNASTDNTIEQCKMLAPSARIIQNSVNVGFGRAVNQLIKSSDAEQVLILNPDVDCSAEQVTELHKLSVGLNEPWLFVAPNTGHVVTTPDTTYKPPTTDPKEIYMAAGAALLFNRKQFLSLGGFDENIFLYYEEMDLCMRAKEAGLKMYYAECISIPHSPGTSVQSTPEVDYMRSWHFRWSAFYFYKKHNKKGKYIGQYLKNLLFTPLKFLTKKTSFLDLKTKLSATLYFICRQQAFDSNGMARFQPKAKN